MTKKTKTPLVFFNASVILAGLASPEGGSAKLLNWIKEGKIIGIISEIVLDEATRHADKIGLKKEQAERRILEFFNHPSPAPESSTVENFKGVVIDFGDSHLLASCFEGKADFLVSLDKKHLLVLKKVRKLKIVSPKQLIERLSKTI